ncbi:MAG: hybrid sensor histidine kinase/response regulator [Alphaproteobacteria bacterium]|nr:MAG: hybrid sensor histidine kinase/response regulator [Alphaproteobacteria bacterium]
MMTELHSQPSPPFNVLIVEDSPEDRELYRRILSRNAGTFRLYEASNIDEGLDLARQHALDCIVLDFQLPDGDGIDFIHKYQDARFASGAAIVMVTGRGSERTAVEVMKLGALDYITKSSILEGFFTQSILNAIERQHLKGEIVRYQQELERSYQALSEFTHTASHDLKAPLRHIVSYCNLIREDFADKLDEKGAEYIKRLGVNAQRLQKLVDDLLAYSEVANSREEKTTVDCNVIMAEVLEVLEEPIRETNATLNVAPLPVITAFPFRVKQLFQNLISNAIKYRSRDRNPVISVKVQDKGNEYQFAIEDNGCGIEPEFSSVIFQAFKRLHTRDEIEGSGLGLSICRKITEMHGGGIWVESKPGTGSVFYFTIPKLEARRNVLYGTTG